MLDKNLKELMSDDELADDVACMIEALRNLSYEPDSVVYQNDYKRFISSLHKTLGLPMDINNLGR